MRRGGPRYLRPHTPHCKARRARQRREKPAEFSTRPHYTSPMSTRYLPPRAAPQSPDPLGFGQAMSQHGTLAQLGRQLQLSRRHLEVVAVALPGAMKRFVQAGTLDETGWTLVADNAAIAAKLRHLHPQLVRLLQEQGLLQTGELRIRVRQS